MGDEVLDFIKYAFFRFDDELKTHPDRYSLDIIHMKQSIKEGAFTNKLMTKMGTKCINRKFVTLQFCYYFKEFIYNFLSSQYVRVHFEELVKHNYQLVVYRGVRDSRETEYFPSRFRKGKKEIIKIPFSTSTSIDYAKNWIRNDPCCVYKIYVKFGMFKRFIYGGKLEYIPLIYIDQTQEEITLGPGLLRLFDTTKEGNKKIYHMVYEPFPMDEEWDQKMHQDCKDVY
jgi:hypothetical protein